MSDDQKEIERIEYLFDQGDFDALKKILPALIEKNVPEAIRINSSFFEPNTPEDEMDRIYVEGMFRAAELGDLKAQYEVGVLYDCGDYGVTQDKEKASYIFKALSDEGHPHSMWIHACELIWGQGSFPKSTEEGLKLLKNASETGSAQACITLATFYNDGEFGYPVDLEQRDKYRKRAIEYDDTTYDPYA